MELNNDNATLQELLTRKKLNMKQIYENLKENEILYNENRELDNKIYKMCEHKWERDYTDYGPYSRPSYICSICESCK